MKLIRHYQPKRKSPYEVRWYVNRKLHCRFFKTEEEREAFIEVTEESLKRHGTDILLGFNATKMRRWMEASLIDPDADPVEVMRFWKESKASRCVPVKLSDAIDELVSHLEKMKRSTGYCRHMRSYLGRFMEDTGDVPVSTLTKKDIRSFVFETLSGYSELTKRHYLRSIKTAFKWWTQQEMVHKNPAIAIEAPTVIPSEPGILTIPEIEALLYRNMNIDPGICGIIALGAFAGMRTSAIAKMEFHEIDFRQRGIHTPAHKTKKHRRQWLDGLPENLWKWLERTPEDIFDLTARQLENRRVIAFKRAGLLVDKHDLSGARGRRKKHDFPMIEAAEVKHPPKNCLRHSFATYHLALHRNPGLTAQILGHRNQQVLHQHYVGYANQKDAEQYFKIAPND